ncbi:MAG: hypothetical protein HUJ68_05650 [Clostridia bacterium]|nr:hypothetical protein [Clostridia bacterium]
MEKEKGICMFDTFFNTEDKRCHVAFLFVNFIIFLSLLWDMNFLAKVFLAKSFEKLDYLILTNSFSGVSYYSYSLYGAGFMYSPYDLMSIFSWLFHMLRSITFFEWILFGFLICYMKSHQTALSKMAYLELKIYFVIRLIIGIMLPLAIHNACLKGLSAQFLVRYRIVAFVALVFILPFFIFVIRKMCVHYTSYCEIFNLENQDEYHFINNHEED